MSNKYYYYRAGVLIGRISITKDDIFCSSKSFASLRWQPEKPFSIDEEPFDRELDQRLPDAIHYLKFGKFDKENYQFSCYKTGIVGGKKRIGELWVQKFGNNPLDILLCDSEIVAFYDNQRNYFGLLVKEGFESLTPQIDFEDPLISKGIHGIQKLGTFMVPMRDNVRLATDVFLPATYRKGTSLATVLIRTCYGRERVKSFLMFTHYGYAVVSQDTRGREASEGIWQPIVNEKEDGFDTLNWIAEQPWSNGDVGMIGASYLAIVQWEAAASNNQHLKAMISMVTGGVPVFDFPYRNGVLSPGTMAWIASMAAKTHQPQNMVRSDWEDVLHTRPLRNIPVKGLKNTISFWEEWMDHEYYDEYWHRANWLVHQHHIDVPTLYISGWYDDVGYGTMQAWDMNRRNQRRHQKLIAGAWRHKMNVSRDIYGNYYGPNAIRYDLFITYLRWYDRYLKGIQNGIDKAPPVSYYTIGENVWHHTTEWPPPDVKIKPLYLCSHGNSNSSKGNGSLSWSLPTVSMTDQYTFNPQDPPPSLMDISENECLVPENYQVVEKRMDVLVFTSEVLQSELIVTGEPVAIIYAASDTKDTDWVVRITDVDQNQNSIRISDGIIRARFRKSFIEPKLLLPGEIVRYEIPLTWISVCLRKGHRIRVEITSGADNSIFPNPNTGNLTADELEWTVAHQTVYSGGCYPSCILLPVQ